MDLFIAKLFDSPAYYVSVVASFAASICIHEYCHAFVAHRLGDDTAKKGGFMTLNPLKVMGWMSIAALLLFGFSWGAVPVKRDNPSRWRRSVISLAGPLSNLALLGLVSLSLKWVYAVFPGVPPQGFVYYIRLFLICALYANAILFLFNILPIPPLDGWGTIEPFLPSPLIPSAKTKNTIFSLFIYLVCFSSTSGIFDEMLEFFAHKFFPAQLTSTISCAEGNQFFEAGDYGNAYKAYEKAAEQGNPEGYLNLACCLAEGWGCNVDAERAFSIFSREDVCEFPLAKLYLGLMKANGAGCVPDYAMARELLSRDDVLEYPLGRGNLGALLAAGLGGERDPAKAFALLNDEEVMSAMPVARFFVASFLMDGEVVEKDEARAFALMNDEEVLETSPAAKLMLGLWYYAGKGTEQDFAKAAELLKAAADAGDDTAAEFLGYQNGEMPDYGMSPEEFLRRRWNEID